jgi:hypothetical protein
MTGTTTLVFVSPGLSNNLPSIPLALFPLRFAFPFAILRLLRFPATDAPATRAAWRASLKFEMSPFALRQVRFPFNRNAEFHHAKRDFHTHTN